MDKPVVYLQGPDGQEETLVVMSPDGDDGTFCATLPANAPEEYRGCWIRIVPADLDPNDYPV